MQINACNLFGKQEIGKKRFILRKHVYCYDVLLRAFCGVRCDYFCSHFQFLLVNYLPEKNSCDV